MYLLATIATDTAEKQTKCLTKFAICIPDSTQSRSHRRVDRSHRRGLAFHRAPGGPKSSQFTAFTTDSFFYRSSFQSEDIV